MYQEKPGHATTWFFFCFDALLLFAFVEPLMEN